MVGWWWVGWRRSTSVQVVLLRRRAAAGGGSGEWRWRGRPGRVGVSEMDGGALVVSRLVTVLAAVLDREV